MNRKKILLVDDSKVASMTEEMILKKTGRFEFRVASDGEEAVQQALAECPDLILMDVVMPKMNGFEACRELRRHEATESVPIIMVTTRGEAESIEAGFQAGCNDYVSKPIDGVELLEKIEKLIGK
jgi:PleD family two-component response regulator